jgi:hypothetical protein
VFFIQIKSRIEIAVFVLVKTSVLIFMDGAKNSQKSSFHVYEGFVSFALFLAKSAV